jgi:uncharacterized membrane protein YoaK (UPF0700 family)
VDAVGYLGLGQVFVANMTGNTVLLGLAIGQADGRDVLQSGMAGISPHMEGNAGVVHLDIQE